MADVASFVPASNYGIQATNPAASLLQGIQGGIGLQESQNQLAAQNLALTQQAQMQQDLATFAQKPNPSAGDYAQIMARYPQLADRFKASYDVMNDAQQKQMFRNVSPVLAAVRSGKPDIADQLLDQQAQAYENSGNQQGAQGARLMQQWLKIDPNSAMHAMGFQLAAADPSKFSDILNSITGTAATEAKLPGEVAKINADAASAQTAAGVASATAPTQVQQATANLNKTNQDIAASQLDGQIKQLDTQIAQANSETQRGQLQLERDKLVLQQKQLQQTQGKAAQDAQDSATQALDTLGQIKNHPGLTGFWTGPGTTWGSIWGKVPGSDRQALQGWVDSLKGQLGFKNLMDAKAANPNGASGFGSLSEGELKLLSGLAGNLDLNSKDFPTVLAKVQKYLEMTQAKGVANPNLPTAGGAFVANSPKYGVITEGRINSILQQTPGATRADVLRFLGVQ